MLATLDLSTILSPFKFIEPYVANKREFRVIDYSEKKTRSKVKKDESVSFPFDVTDYASMKEFIDVINRFLINGKKELLKLSPQQASIILENKELNSVLDILPTLNTLLSELDEPHTLLESNMIVSSRGFVTHVLDIVELINDIANRKPINEESDEYLDFLNNLAEVGLKSKRMSTGNSLRELLEDAI